MSRSSRRMIFPDLVFGRSAVTMIFSGRAIAPIFWATWSFSSFSNFAGSSLACSSSEAFTITNAAMAVPLISWLIPTTAASAIDW